MAHKDKIPPIYKCRGRWCKSKDTCLRFTSPEAEGITVYDEMAKEARAKKYTTSTACSWWWSDKFKPRRRR